MVRNSRGDWRATPDEDELERLGGPLGAGAVRPTTALDDLAEKTDTLGRERKAPLARCNATLIAGEPAAVAADAEALGLGRVTTFKLKLGAGRRRRRCAPCARDRPDGADPRRRQRRLERREAKRVLTAIEPSTSSSPSSRRRRCTSWRKVAARARSRSPPTRAW